MEILVRDEQDSMAIELFSVQSVVEQTLSFFNEKCDEVSIFFVTEECIGEIHADYFGDPSPTDCISFPMDDPFTPYRVLGEVVVCPETALKYVKQHGGCIREEITLYIVHGLIHLMGFDDIEEKEREKMRQLERQAIDHLKKCNTLIELNQKS